MSSHSTLNFLLFQVLSAVMNKPIVIFLPWLGAQDEACEKYFHLYEGLGFSVIRRKGSLLDFLWPPHGLREAQKFLLDVQSRVVARDYPVVVHCMSIGCYFYALMLMCIKREPLKFKKFMENVKCQVVDSPVVGSLHKMATGIAVTSSKSSVLQSAIIAASHTYFAMSRPWTVSYYNQSIETMTHDAPSVPSLLMSSYGDPMASLDGFMALTNSWQKKCCETKVKLWPESKHAQHLKNYPNAYKDLVYEILGKSLCDLLHIPSKM